MESTLSLATKLHQAGNLAEAEKLYRQILQAEPRNPMALHLLGVLAHQLGRNDLAVDYIQQAIRLHSDFPAAHNNLGIVLTAVGKLDGAIASYQQALRLKPDFAEAYYNLGNALKDQGKLEEAITKYRHALHLKPNYVEASSNLGSVYTDLGNVQMEQGKVEAAAASYRQSLGVKPDFAEAHNNLGNALKAQWQDEEAVASYRRALRIKPDYADAHSNLGGTLAELGRIDEAVASFHESLRFDPKQNEAMCRLAGVLRGKLPEADRARLEQRLTESDLKDDERVRLLFGLAVVCDAKEEYAQAAALLRQANALTLSLRHRKGQSYNLVENARFVVNIMEAFSPAFFERVRGFGLDTQRPIFIVGLPRSGTTLTEQILAAHSQVFGAGELTLGRKDFQVLGTHITDAGASSAGLRDAFQRQAQWHLDQFGAMNRTAVRVVDKMPDNYFYLGVLAALFPRAKFIHCRRDLRDVAVSCWFTDFRDYRWANDLGHIAAGFGEYQRLMEHWRKVLPVPILEVQYEETVTDLPGAARRLVEWCGLEWEPACLAFHEGKNPVRTASVVQVRQPVYTKSVGRWRHYESDLGSLFTTLAALK